MPPARLLAVSRVSSPLWRFRLINNVGCHFGYQEIKEKNKGGIWTGASTGRMILVCTDRFSI